jgi:hypothetical protein
MLALRGLCHGVPFGGRQLENSTSYDGLLQIEPSNTSRTDWLGGKGLSLALPLLHGEGNSLPFHIYVQHGYRHLLMHLDHVGRALDEPV